MRQRKNFNSRRRKLINGENGAEMSGRGVGDNENDESSKVQRYIFSSTAAPLGWVCLCHGNWDTGHMIVPESLSTRVCVCVFTYVCVFLEFYSVGEDLDLHIQTLRLTCFWGLSTWLLISTYSDARHASWMSNLAGITLRQQFTDCG